MCGQERNQRTVAVTTHREEPATGREAGRGKMVSTHHGERMEGEEKRARGPASPPKRSNWPQMGGGGAQKLVETRTGFEPATTAAHLINPSSHKCLDSKTAIERMFNAKVGSESWWFKALELIV